MIAARTNPLSALYEADETAWLETTARLVAERRFEELDIEHLSEYLSDMAIREKRKVLSRLTVLLAHLLKWEFQPDGRTGGWWAMIAHQRTELADALESGTLRRHAAEVLAKAYTRAVMLAAGETGLPAETFPADCPYVLDDLTREIDPGDLPTG